MPFLGDEVTGKTIAIIGTGRIGLAMIKKCTGFDMNILCYDPAYQNHDYVESNSGDDGPAPRPRHSARKDMDQVRLVLKMPSRQADFVSVHVPLLREGESSTPTYHLFNERTLRMMKPTAFLVNTSRGPVIDEGCAGQSPQRKMDCRRRPRRLRERASAGGFSAARSGD